MKFVFPLKLSGSLNAREHWRARSRRVKQERDVTALAWRQFAGPVPPGPLVVTLTRVAPRPVDSDNLAGRLKGVRDQVAAQLGVDDGSASVEWRYAQHQGLPSAHAVEVEVQARAEWVTEEMARLAADARQIAALPPPCDVLREPRLDAPLSVRASYKRTMDIAHALKLARDEQLTAAAIAARIGRSDMWVRRHLKGLHRFKRNTLLANGLPAVGQ